MLIAQITDLHVRPEGTLAYGRVDTNAMLRACVQSLLALPRRPDVVIASGDLTDCGLDEEMSILETILSDLPMPVYLVPGNHDRRETLRAIAARHTYLGACGDFLHYTVDDFPVKLIAVDSVVPGATHGELCESRLAWLEARLEERREAPVIVFMHHPPFPVGVGWLDAQNCLNGARMAEIVQRYPNVERVLAGHHHRSVQVRWAGTIGSIAPSPAHQILLDLSEAEARGAGFVMEPPAYHLHLWRAGTGVITHQVAIGTFEGPHPFLLDPNYPGQRAAPQAGLRE